MFGVWKMGLENVMALDERGLGAGRRRSIFRWRSGVLGFCGSGAWEVVMMMIVVAMVRKREGSMGLTLWNFMSYSFGESRK